MDFPQILLQLKNQTGYTNAFIGNACGVSESAVRTWLSGKKVPSINALKSLSDLFGVSTDYLLGNEQKEKTRTVLTDDARRKWIKDMMPMVEKLSLEKLELLKQFSETMLEQEKEK